MNNEFFDELIFVHSQCHDGLSNVNDSLSFGNPYVFLPERTCERDDFAKLRCDVTLKPIFVFLFFVF